MAKTAIADKDGQVNVTTLLADLLGALGIVLDGSAKTEAQFKQNLYKAAMSKVRELTGEGSAGTTTPSKQPNPLIAGGKVNPADLRTEEQPMHFSTGQISDLANNFTDPNAANAALSLAIEAENLARQKEEDAYAAEKARQARINTVIARRQPVIDRIIKITGPTRTVMDQIDAITNGAGAQAALSHGNGTDPALSQLEQLERRLRSEQGVALSSEPITTGDPMSATAELDALAEDMGRRMDGRLRQPEGIAQRQPTPPTDTDEDRLVADMQKRMGCGFRR